MLDSFVVFLLLEEFLPSVKLVKILQCFTLQVQFQNHRHPRKGKIVYYFLGRTEIKSEKMHLNFMYYLQG